MNGCGVPHLQDFLLYLPSKNSTLFIIILSLLFSFALPKDRLAYSETAAEEFIPATLSNGMRVLTIERPHTDTVTINLYIGIGRINEPESGAANLLLHMLFRGSKKYPAQEITKEVARMGGRLDYYVGYLSTLISISLPSNPPSIPPLKKEGKGGFNKAIALLADVILNPALDTDELNKERSLILQKLAISKDFPVNRFFKEVMLRQFPDHPFGRSSEGTEDSVKKLNAELLKSIHRRYYALNNISVVIVGNVVKEAVEARLKEVFHQMVYMENGIQNSAIRNPQSVIVPRRIILNEHVTQAQIFVGRPVPGLSQKGKHILLVMDQVLSGLNGRLFNTLRKKKGHVYSVSIWDAIYPEIGLWGVYAGTKTSGLKTTERLIVSELKRLVRKPVNHEELKTAQKLLETAIRTKYETNSSFAREIGSSLVRREAILPMEERIKLVKSVTAEDIKSLAEKLFGSSEFNIIIMK
ncbi:MAG: M16 family metallopeptidase [Candidatus Brocadiales bacterium]